MSIVSWPNVNDSNWPERVTFASAVTEVEPKPDSNSCSGETGILTLPSAEIENVPIVQSNCSPVTDTFAFPEIVSLPNELVKFKPFKVIELT